MQYEMSGGKVLEVEVSSEAEAFLRRMMAAVDEATLTEGALIQVLYSKENPLLDPSIFESDRGAVTPALVASPVYLVMLDLLARKNAQQRAIAPAPGLRLVGTAPWDGTEGAELAARIGSGAHGVSFRLRGALVVGAVQGRVRAGPIVAGWSRLAVLASSAGATWCWVLGPALAGTTPKAIAWEGFFVRGVFEVVDLVKDPTAARALFETFSSLKTAGGQP